MLKIKSFLLLFLLSIFCFASISDTLTYKQKRKSKTTDAYLDVESGAVRTIQSDHSHIHNYEAYSINCIDTLANNEVCMYAIQIPDSVEFHLKYINAWGEGSPFLIKVFNDPSLIALSSDTLTPNNRNQADNKRNVSIGSYCTVTDSVDTIFGANLLDPSYFGGGSGVGGSSFAGSSPNEIEWVFEGDYVIVTLQNVSGDPQKSTLCIFWYEVVERD